ncbi:hypothetical protein NDU88_011515 [Pleurodeles waltl]|uniref:Ig-like domain-containing protein n=1 Tax=Pleurodeles waltl TaxID=8319 RepID=A0AAV7Q3G7_PLEWA|nr:hypothetical protein NDU88_011515 [Pleurodeles waltl]
MSDPQTLTVTHGPENVKIIPPVSQLLQVGDKLSLSCTVESVPAPQYQWLLNNSDLNRPGNTYTIEKVSLRDNGNYTCVAYNTDTGLSAKASVSIAVYGMNAVPMQPDDALVMGNAWCPTFVSVPQARPRLKSHH